MPSSSLVAAADGMFLAASVQPAIPCAPESRWLASAPARVLASGLVMVGPAAGNWPARAGGATPPRFGGGVRGGVVGWEKGDRPAALGAGERHRPDGHGPG